MTPKPSVLYRIADWNALFENARSREIKNLSFVAIPNRHDGENYSAIMQHPQGATIFAAFVLMVQVASRCFPRGLLIRDDGTPHTPKSLSAKTRAPVVWFEICLDYLSKETDWIEIIQNTEENRENATTSQEGAMPWQQGAMPWHQYAVGQDRTGQELERERARDGAGIPQQEAIKELLSTLFVLYRRPISQKAEDRELQLSNDICGRDDWRNELTEIAEFRQALKPEDVRYFPNTMLSLLKGWQEAVDRVRALRSLKRYRTAVEAKSKAAARTVIAPTPPPMTEEQREAWRKRCEEARQSIR